ncbi:hypothetical protein M885DRAFT_14433 [Pelagophyceae sp. CCMP2097]|nr:hypothetical protein M885DRAFT_14433 [Pelagophyceae sp. CCMP2097]
MRLIGTLPRESRSDVTATSFRGTSRGPRHAALVTTTLELLPEDRVRGTLRGNLPQGLFRAPFYRHLGDVFLWDPVAENVAISPREPSPWPRARHAETRALSAQAGPTEDPRQKSQTKGRRRIWPESCLRRRSAWSPIACTPTTRFAASSKAPPAQSGPWSPPRRRRGRAASANMRSDASFLFRRLIAA